MGIDSRSLTSKAFFWVLQSLCSLHGKPFSLVFAQQQYVPPFTRESLHRALQAHGFDVVLCQPRTGKLERESFPILAWLASAPEGGDSPVSEDADKSGIEVTAPALILQADSQQVLLTEPGHPTPRSISHADFNARYLGQITRVTIKPAPANDSDSDRHAFSTRRFGFAWFYPEFAKHKRLWQEVLLASLVIQLLGLGIPLFTQAVIDKVVVHRTQSTLIVIAIGMAVFMLFSAALSWLRQYLVLHTGNRVDAALGGAVFERLCKLPPLYFQHRPTGVIGARLQGLENIREFIASAGVTLALDLPFLLIFVAIMLYYSVSLTLLALAVLGAIAGLSLLVAPLFQQRLQEQFQFGARNQAFLTEYLVGMETVKSLQLEPQLNGRYGGYLASYLATGFATRQLANTYNTAAGLLEQMLSLLILAAGAWTVMHTPEFTIGMLVAFQMFAGKLSQPMLRLVGLWQQYQQAKLAVIRLGDLMNAPVEPYSLLPSRTLERRGEICIEQLAFRYREERPPVYENVSLSIRPGEAVAIVGASGCGKSTLAKLLQGFYQPTTGSIRIDGVDIRHLAANELRSHFGVVPQEVTLFSGSIHDNLQMANPSASFAEIVTACRMAEIHEAIEALPQGYQTQIGERGAGLSGGQRQRIAIARALLRCPSILIFDEATSALDGATAEQFARTINRLKGKVTMLFIAHGLPAALKLDAVFRLGTQGAQRVALAPVAGSSAAGDRRGSAAVAGEG